MLLKIGIYTLGVTCLLSYHCPAMADDHQYVYKNYATYGTRSWDITIDLDKKKVVYADTYDNILMCSIDGMDMCFSSSSFSFCIPTNLDMSKSWVCGGKQFQNKGDSEIDVLGRPLKVKMITSGNTTFYYSWSDGLIALKFQKKDNSAELPSFYLIANSIGLGAHLKN